MWIFHCGFHNHNLSKRDFPPNQPLGWSSSRKSTNQKTHPLITMDFQDPAFEFTTTARQVGISDGDSHLFEHDDLGEESLKILVDIIPYRLMTHYWKKTIFSHSKISLEKNPTNIHWEFLLQKVVFAYLRWWSPSTDWFLERLTQKLPAVVGDEKGPWWFAVFLGDEMLPSYVIRRDCNTPF